MPQSGDVNITVLDNGGSQVTVPLSSVQAVIGWASITNIPYSIIATASPTSLQSAAGYGTGVEAAGLTAAQGSVVLFCPVPLTGKGTASAVTHTAGGTGSSALTVALDANNGAWDDYLVRVLWAVGGTIGSVDGKAFQLSLDNGRTYGTPILLNTATTYAVANTGLTLNFGAGTVVANDSYTFGTTGPGIADASVNTAIQALVNSQYGVTGWGSMHIVGNIGGYAARTGGCPGADAQTITNTKGGNNNPIGAIKLPAASIATAQAYAAGTRYPVGVFAQYPFLMG